MGFSVHTTNGVEINTFETFEKAKFFAYRLKGKQTGINYFIYKQELVYITGSEHHLLSHTPAIIHRDSTYFIDPVNIAPVLPGTFFRTEDDPL